MSRRRGTEPPQVSEMRELAETILRARAKTSGPEKKNSTALLHRAGPTPTRISVNDFFSYAETDPFPVDDDDVVEGDAIRPVEPGDETRHVAMQIQEAGQSADKGQAVSGDKGKTADMSRSQFKDPSGIVLPGDSDVDESFVQRIGVGRVETTFNDSRKDAYKRERSVANSVAVEVLKQYSHRDKFRFMNDDILNRIEAVRCHVKAMGERILARARAALPEGQQLPQESASSFIAPSSDTVMAIGRVRVELDETDGAGVGRINPSSVVLESVDGNLLKLNLSRVRASQKQIVLHTGMVVAVQGVNTNGRVMDVREIHDNAISIANPVAQPGAKLEFSVTPMDEGGEEQHDSRFARVLIAAGPYSSKSNLRYEPLDELISVIKRSEPDVVVLTGPFVESGHPLVMERLPVAFDDLFEARVLRRIEKCFTGGDTAGYAPHIVMVPSLEDAHHDFVCPQPPLSSNRALPSHITMAANPAVFTVTNGSGTYSASIAVTSLPTLRDISGDCIVWNKQDRIAAIASHMLRQCSFYPTFPPSAEVPLDTSHLERVAMPDMPHGNTVDLLIVPSKLKAFAKAADGGTLVVNPGMLCKGSAGGTYCEITMPLHDATRGRSLQAVVDSSYAEIVRI